MCAHCRQLGHAVNKCFKLHGYSNGFRSSSIDHSGYEGQPIQTKSSFVPCRENSFTPKSNHNSHNVQKNVANILTRVASS